MMVSVLTTAFRPGLLDVTLAGMRDQTFRDFELIVVDRRWEHRRGVVRWLAEKYGVRCIHIPEHRRNGKWACIGSAWNTAMAVARGDILIFLQDGAYAPPGWIEAHMRWHEQDDRVYMIGPYRYLGLPPLRLKPPFDAEGFDFSGDRLHCTEQGLVLQGKVLDEMFAFIDGPFEPAWLPGLPVLSSPQDPRDHKDGTQIPDTHLHIKNESMRREVAYELNGLDERLDRGKGPLDLDWGLRLSAAGVKLIWDSQLYTPALNGREIVPTMPWGTMDERLEGRWSWQDGLAYNARRREECKVSLPTAKNPFDLLALSYALESWRYETKFDIARIEVPDHRYWGPQVIWPDTAYPVEPGPSSPGPVARSRKSTEEILAPWQSKGDAPPPGGVGPMCPDCGLSRWVEIGGGAAKDAYHPNIDAITDANVDIVADLESGTLPFHDDHAERVKAIHALQHLSRDGARAILHETHRILRPGGSLYLMIGDGEFIADRLRVDGFHEAWLNCVFHGPALTEQGFHRWMWTYETMKAELEAAGFTEIGHRGWYNSWELKIECRKPAG